MSDMEFTKYWTAERARKKQTALTKLSNGLIKEVFDNPLVSEIFEPDEIAAMKAAAEALGRAKQKFAHIKEKKARIEKRKEQERAAINKECKRHAAKVMDSLNPNHDTFTREQFCLWLATSPLTRLRDLPDVWELDINHNIDHHYLGSDHELRQRHVWSMRDSTLKVFEDFLHRSWEFSIADDCWRVKVPVEKAASKILSIIGTDEYTKIEKLYAKYIEPIETFNREVEAIKRRKNIKSIS